MNGRCRGAEKGVTKGGDGGVRMIPGSVPRIWSQNLECPDPGQRDAQVESQGTVREVYRVVLA